MGDPSPLEPADLVIVLSTAPPGAAADLGARLVDEGLAACVNLVPGLRSLYRWKGERQDDPETLLWIKVPRAGVEALTRRLQALHPYEVPEVLVLGVESGTAAYLAWAREGGRTGTEGPPRGPA
jgi:periplasmic divalent cation tolerance protein